MSSVGAARSEHSHLGIASFVLSFLPVALLVGAFALVLYPHAQRSSGDRSDRLRPRYVDAGAANHPLRDRSVGARDSGGAPTAPQEDVRACGRGVQRPRSGGDPRLCRTRTLGLWHPGAYHQPTRGPPQRIVARERIVLLPAALGRRTSEN